MKTFEYLTPKGLILVKSWTDLYDTAHLLDNMGVETFSGKEMDTNEILEIDINYTIKTPKSYQLKIVKNRLAIGFQTLKQHRLCLNPIWSWFYSLENKATEKNDHVLQLCIFGINVAFKHRIED